MIAHRRRDNTLRPEFTGYAATPEERKAQVGFVVQRFRVTPQAAETSLTGMSIATRTLLALEMNERRRDSFISDYDPFEGL